MRTSSPPRYTLTNVAISPSLKICVPERRIALDEILEHGADRVAVGLDLALAADLGAQRRWNANGGHACTGPWQNST